MMKPFMKWGSRAAIIFAMCMMFPAVLWSAPICAVSSDADALYEDPGDVSPLASEWEFTYTQALDGLSTGYSMASPIELAAVATAESGPPASTLLVIGAAMIWIAGIIRYRLSPDA